jgi:hypothetical protein
MNRAIALPCQYPHPEFEYPANAANKLCSLNGVNSVFKYLIPIAHTTTLEQTKASSPIYTRWEGEITTKILFFKLGELKVVAAPYTEIRANERVKHEIYQMKG